MHQRYQVFLNLWSYSSFSRLIRAGCRIASQEIDKKGSWRLPYQLEDLEARVATTRSADRDVSLDWNVEWILDSGALCHFCYDSSKFVKKCFVSTAKKRESTLAIGVGNCQINTQTANGEVGRTCESGLGWCFVCSRGTLKSAERQQTVSAGRYFIHLARTLQLSQVKPPVEKVHPHNSCG